MANDERSKSCPTGDAPVALLLIDVINDFDFPGSDVLRHAAEACAPRIDRLAERARRAGVPVVYVNDNFGRWRSDFRATVESCLQGKKGRAVVARLEPRVDDYFVLKPLHSGFLSTTLQLLLEYLGAETLVVAGFATNICVVFTANDAYMRGYRLVIPEDCTASNSEELTRAALEHTRVALGADTPASDKVDFDALAKLPRTGRRPGL